MTGTEETLPALPSRTFDIAHEVLEERRRQIAKWGNDQRLPDGTGEDRAQVYVAALQKVCESEEVTWAAVLLEEVAEAMAEKPGSPNLRTELLQVAAVCIQWCESIDRRGEQTSPLRWGPGRGLTA